MRIQSVNNFYNINNVNITHKKQTFYSNISNPAVDTFVRQPVFCGKKSPTRAAKIIDETLKNIDGLHDPYSNIIMLPTNKFKSIMRNLEEKRDAVSAVKYISKFKKYMFPSETKVLSILEKHQHDVYKDAEGKRVPTNFHTILMGLLPESKARLVNAQLNVVENIRNISKEKLSKTSQNDVESYLTIIEKDIMHDRFRIKPSRDLLERLYDEVPDKKVVDEIMKTTRDFPNSATSTDAFIVKNARQSHHKIAESLLSPSTITVEHINPKSKGGEDKGTNYLAASKRMNNYRQSLPMPDFIAMFPKIPQYTQRYMNDLIGKVNRGGVPDVADTIFGVKDTLKKESKGKINVDISALDPKIAERVKGFQDKIDSLVLRFNPKRKNKSSRS